MSKTRRIALIFIVILTILFVVALMVGKYVIPVRVFFEIVFGKADQHQIPKSIIVNLRVPRTIVAIFVGAALSLSGLVYQETFRNKLVSPDFLGVSSGASVGAALAIILGLSSWFISIFAFSFGLSAMILTILLASMIQKQSPTILVLSGIIISSLMSAILSIIKYAAPSEIILADITFWLMGSFASVTIRDILILVPVVVIGASILYSIRWKINIVGQGPLQAQSLGLNYRKYQVLIIVLATFLTATSVAFAGVIGWIGLVVPHIIRFFVGKNTHRTVPLTILFGAIFMLIADVLSRTFTSSEIPLSAITGLLGTIIFGVTLYSKRGGFSAID